MPKRIARSFSSVSPMALSQATATTISGLPYKGQVLTMTPGTVSGESGSVTYTFSWERKGSMGGWSPIGGQTGTTYTVAPGDVGSQIRGVTTATDDLDDQNPLVLASNPTANIEESAPGLPDDSNGVLQGKTAYEALSLQAVFAEQYRPIVVEAVAGDATSFDVKADATLGKPAPNDGEMQWFLNWLSNHFTGDILDARAAGYFRLSAGVKNGRVVPGGGAKPNLVTTA